MAMFPLAWSTDTNFISHLVSNFNPEIVPVEAYITRCRTTDRNYSATFAMSANSLLKTLRFKLD
jgi:hypothetical protein